MWETFIETSLSPPIKLSLISGRTELKMEGPIKSPKIKDGFSHFRFSSSRVLLIYVKLAPNDIIRSNRQPPFMEYFAICFGGEAAIFISTAGSVASLSTQLVTADGSAHLESRSD